MRVRTKVIREGRALYLLEDIALPEGQPLIVTIETTVADDDSDSGWETLDDALGFDVEAEGNRQRQALLEMVASSTAASGLTDVSARHDYYIYAEPYEKR